MVNRYFQIVEFVDREDDELADLLPLPAQHKRLKALLDDLKNIESVSKRLQSEEISMWEVRILFDALIALKPTMKGYLGKSKPSHCSVHSNANLCWILFC